MTAVAAPYVLGEDGSRWGMEVSGMRLDLLARSADTGGRLTFLRYRAPAGWPGPPLHRHDDLDEGVLVLEGSLRVRLGDDEHDVGPGGFAWLSREVPHAFANAGDTPAVFAGFVSPPGEMEEFFAAAAEEAADAGGVPDPEALTELNERHGMEVLGPPLLAPAGP